MTTVKDMPTRKEIKKALNIKLHGTSKVQRFVYKKSDAIIIDVKTPIDRHLFNNCMAFEIQSVHVKGDFIHSTFTLSKKDYSRFMLEYNFMIENNRI